MMTRLIKEFNSGYDCLKDVYKCILMYLSVAAAIQRLIEHVGHIKYLITLIPWEWSQDFRIHKSHVKVMKELLEYSVTKHESTVSIFKEILSKNVGAKIAACGKNSEKSKKILTDYNIPELIKQTNEGKFETEEFYMKKYREVINDSNV